MRKFLLVDNTYTISIVHKALFTCLYLLIILVPLSGQFQDFSIQNYSVEDGLPSNECHRIIQDSLGYIWIATDRGLVQWDGYEFKTYGIDEGLSLIHI